MVHTVIVTIDDHETVLGFESKELAEAFVKTERARLTEDEKDAQRRCERLAVGHTAPKVPRQESIPNEDLNASNDE